MNEDNMMKLSNYLDSWIVKFESSVHKSLCDSIGYSLQKEFVVRTLAPPSPKEEAEWLKEELNALKNLQDGFISTCQKSKILKRYVRDPLNPMDFDYMGEGLSEWHPHAGPLSSGTVTAARQFNLFLDEEIQDVKNKLRKCSLHKYPTKQRIPTAVAFELLRALCFCSGNAASLKHFELLLSPHETLEKTVQKILAKLKDRILKSLDEESEYKMKSRKEYVAPLVRKKINELILEEKEEYRRVKEFKISWLPFKYRGEPTNTRWANHLKDHLIKTILSSNEPTIRKSFKGIQRQKLALLKKVEEQNRAAISK